MKSKHPDALLLFRKGDFYECYEEDAIQAAAILGITNIKDSDNLTLAGFPHHALDTYLPKLIRAGVRVAICDELEAPKAKAKVLEVVKPAAKKRSSKKANQSELFNNTSEAK